jgi:hypothetical protein
MVGQVARRSLEAAGLVVLREQIADRVLDQVDQRVGAPGRDARHVTQGDLDGIPIRLLAHSGNHVRHNSMPSTCSPAAISRSAIRPAPSRGCVDQFEICIERYRHTVLHERQMIR